MKDLLWVIFFIGVILVTGLVLIVIGFKDLSEGISSLAWPATTGQVSSQEIQSYEISNDDGVTTRYRVVINYQFQVGGSIFQGTRFRIGKGGFMYKLDASDLLERLIDGSQCKVFYDPDNPRTCTLVKGSRLSHYFFPIGGLLFISFGSFLIWKCNWEIKPTNP